MRFPTRDPVNPEKCKMTEFCPPPPPASHWRRPVEIQGILGSPKYFQFPGECKDFSGFLRISQDSLDFLRKRWGVLRSLKDPAAAAAAAAAATAAAAAAPAAAQGAGAFGAKVDFPENLDFRCFLSLHHLESQNNHFLHFDYP